MMKMLRRLLPLFCLTLALVALDACVLAPPPPGYVSAPGYYYPPGYAYPGYSYAPGYSYPPFVGSVNLGFRYWHGGRHRR